MAQVAIITASDSGIGKECALLLAQQGFDIGITWHSDEEGAKDTARKVVSHGVRAEIVQLDLGNLPEGAQALEKLIQRLGRIDVLVNNAGITRDNLILRMSEEEFDAVVETNLKGCFHTIRHLSRYFLKQRSGKIINIASVSGVLGNAGQANYAASKAGIIGLTKTVARELASRGITVNAVAPGFVHTEMTEVLSEQVKEAAVAQIPLGRFGEPEDIANVVAFLASEKADYITGQVICVDGGMVM